MEASDASARNGRPGASSSDCDSKGLPPYPLPHLPDGWVWREGYGGPELGEKRFSNYLIFVV
jgi:hypothetical protein